jgi:hypothetical protein
MRRNAAVARMGKKRHVLMIPLRKQMYAGIPQPGGQDPSYAPRSRTGGGDDDAEGERDYEA